MGITINRLHKLLGKLIAEGHGRRPVCIDKPSFTHNLESDGCVILEVESAEIHSYRRLDDDGGTAINADGSERMLTSLVLDGGGESSLNREGSL
jgi:hypothetical protein